MKDNMKFIWVYAQNYKMRFFLMLVSILLTSISGALFPFFLGKMINSLLYQRDFYAFFMYFCGYGIFFIAQQLMRYINTRLYAILETTFIYDIRRDALKSTFLKSAVALSDLNRGDIISRIEDDAHEVLDYIYYNLFYTISDVFEFISQIILILLINEKLLVLTIISMPISFVFPKLFSKIAEKYYKKQLQVNGEFLGWILDIINNLIDIRLLSGKEKVCNDFEKRREKLNRTKIEVSKVEVFTQIGIEGTGVILKIMLYSMSAILVFLNQLLIGDFISVIEYFNSSLDLFNDMAGRSNPITENMVAISRVKELVIQDDKIDDVSTTLETVGSDISFKDVSFFYDSKENEVIKNATFSVKQGEHVVIAGKSGCGKTTLIRLLIGFYKPTMGNIYIGDKNIAEFEGRLSPKIGIVFQNTAIFDGSIRYNLIFDENKDRDEELWNVLKMVGLASNIQALREKLSTLLSNQDMILSGGQMQRLGIARALLTNPEIIIFDEPTSAFDIKSECDFLEMCNTKLSNKTIVMISHRLETLRSAKRIIFINDGVVEGCGNHEDLLKQSATYRKYVSEGE
ncbi:MAG: ABC transporter ATP-binding protein [Lachnospiraceae bacterium]